MIPRRIPVHGFLIAGLVLALAGCGSKGSGGYPSTQPTPPTTGSNNTTTTITVPAGDGYGTTFMPGSLTVAVGTIVTWQNRDAVAHTTTSDTAGLWNGALGPGAEFSRTFSTTGSFAYHCTVHNGMSGAIIVQ